MASAECPVIDSDVMMHVPFATWPCEATSKSGKWISEIEMAKKVQETFMKANCRI